MTAEETVNEMAQNGLILFLIFFPLPEVVKSRGIDLFSKHIFDGCICDDIRMQESEAKSQQPEKRSKVIRKKSVPNSVTMNNILTIKD